MKGVAVYVEGGGSSVGTRSQLRQGLNALLAPQIAEARRRHVAWRTVLCGPRAEAFKMFDVATKSDRDEFVVLLVDAESAVAAQTDEGRVEHLRAQDGWMFDGVSPDRVHLMTQCMEAWIVADGDALAAHYGKGFRADDLPRTEPLDRAP